MQCMVCGGVMDVVQTSRAASLAVGGYVHHTFKCSHCGEREERLLFRNAESMVEQEPPRPAIEQEEPPQGAWARALRRLSEQQQDLTRRAALTREHKRHEAFTRDWERSFRPVAAGGEFGVDVAKPADIAHRMRGARVARAVPPRAEIAEASPASRWERAVARLGSRRIGTPPVEREPASWDEFDQIWEGDRGVGAGRALSPPPSPSRSLVPVVSADTALWARAIVLLRGGPMAHPGASLAG